MILYKMLFLHMPYPDVDDFETLQADIVRYPGYEHFITLNPQYPLWAYLIPTLCDSQVVIGSPDRFIPTPDLIRQCERRHIPRDMLILLSKVVNVDPESMASAVRVKLGLRSLVCSAFHH